MTTRAPQARLKQLLEVAGSAASRLWTDERLFYAALCVFNLFLARRTFKSGIWADADSVCHYAYVRHLLEEFYPATGTFIGFTPKFDLGAPFLLYNTPPGVYVSAAVVSKLTGLSALLALKSVMVVAFLAVPIVGAQLARTFTSPGASEGEARDLPKFVALALSLFSAELFGLEFYFKNCMLNPALGVPLLLATLLFYRRAQMASGPRTVAWLALAGGAFAATAFVHLLSTYMLALALGCCALAAGPRRAGRSLVQIGVVVGLGAGLAAFWLVPSMPFAAPHDAAFTWIRRAEDTLSNYADGSLLSSYPVGFYPQFVTYSSVGIVAILCAAFGVWRAVRLRAWPVLSFAGCAVLALLVMLGPRPSFGLSILPMYDRLLWYRFATLLELCTLLVAGWGAWQLHELRARLGNVVVHALLGGAAWAALVMTQRAVKIETAQDYPQFVQDVDEVSAWLRDHGKPGGRVFSEFLGQDVVDSVGVNYPRHMIPILSGYPAAGGWVYENDLAAQAMMKLGVFWFDPFPMIAKAPRYDVQYIVAGSPNFVRVLGDDPRWRRVLATSHVTLFEAVGREPALAEAPGWDVKVASQRYLRGGGYEYTFDATRTAGGGPVGALLVKTGWSTAWRARSGDRELRVDRTDDSLVTVTLPEGVDHASVTLTWDISALRAKGDRISLAALAFAAAMLLYGTRRKVPAPAIPEGL
ncbi:MAG: 6-pyruvoyl-tetrahydropterin synthase-related protein, partial [Polyangiaceae bacterium]